MNIVRSKAPLRINFAGGGTDCEPYLSDYGGYILSAAIKMYSHVVVGDTYKPILPIELLLSEIANQSIHIFSDVSKTSGLGGSGSCFVAGLKAIYPQLEKAQLANLALYLERKVLNNITGSQDHYCATFGGLLFLVTEGTKVEINQLSIPNYLSQLLLLIYTHDRVKDGAEIIRNQMSNVKSLHHQKQLAKTMRDNIMDYKQFAILLNEVWQTKKEASQFISTPEINNLYERCLSMGALGGCLMGAGGGGYLLLMENPDEQGELRMRLIENGIHYNNIEFDIKGVRLLIEDK